MTFKPGHKPSDKTRRKLSMAARGNQHSKGRVWSSESRAKLSEAMKGNRNCKGYVPTPEHRAKLSKANKGRAHRPPGWQHSAEAREKISASLKGTLANPKKRESLVIAQRVIKLFRPELHARKAALSSERMKAQLQDAAFLARVAAGQRARRMIDAALREDGT